MRTNDGFSESATRLVFAGARSVGLALQALTLCELTQDSHPEVAQRLRAYSEAVLRDWGINVDPVAAPSSLVAPSAPLPAEEDPLVWPPNRPPTKPLSQVYSTNFYRVRTERVTGLRAIGAAEEEFRVDPEALLAFHGSAEWDHRYQDFLMCVQLPDGTLLWLHSRDLKPTDQEVPPDARVV